VKNVQRDIALCHAVDKACYGFLVVLGGERSGEPQAERPCGRQCRLARQIGVAHQHLAEIIAADNAVAQLFAFNAELRFGRCLGAYFKTYKLGVIHINAIAPVR
jgi:hypothetical protein